jgi:peptidase E
LENSKSMNKLNKKEIHNLTNLLESNTEENINVAKEIINNYLNNVPILLVKGYDNSTAIVLQNYEIISVNEIPIRLVMPLAFSQPSFNTMVG